MSGNLANLGHGKIWEFHKQNPLVTLDSLFHKF